ncbi:NADP-dependent oxidoreductase [Lentilactobacillus sp. Marseille-Q4993]|uniref:NADP-dependent oxidoreductase n=1 Tax=Lentilactobacillus sp. Marseille-Q4993 TaxID=3039492 RepID=UPI0024BC8D70|nr:NADP-dependent oxidoreductase [Lentilactobacillus sp. Marseille-Q4993]
MKAFGYDHNGGPEVIEEYDVPTPELKDKDILIETQAVGLNNFERASRAGDFRTTTHRVIPGRDVAGIVKQVGSDVTKFAPSDRVVAHGHHSYSEFATSDETNTVKLPDDISFVQAAGIVTPGVTAYNAVNLFGQVEPGQTVIVKGASGGVGSLAAQIAADLGANVIGIGSSKHEADVKALGVSRYVAYDKEDPATVLAGQGDVVINSAMNGASSDDDVAMVKDGGIISSVAHDEPETSKNIQFNHIAPTSEVSDTDALSKIIELMTNKGASIKIGYEYPFSLDGFRQGHQTLEEKHSGRVIIKK